MKRILTFLTAITLIISLTGCKLLESVSSRLGSSAGENASESSDSGTGSLLSDVSGIFNSYVLPYAQKVLEVIAEDPDASFFLIRLDEDDVPELVAGKTGDWVSLYTINDGNVSTLMDHWSYGVAGNQGYEYIECGSLIRNFNNDFAGMIVYETYWTFDDGKLYELYSITEYHFDDADGDGLPSPDDEYSEEPVARTFFGDPITEEQYENLRFTGDFRPLAGQTGGNDFLKNVLHFNG